MSSKGYAKHNIFEGETLSWYKNGKPKAKGNYRNGQLDGSVIHWSKEGKKSTVNYIDGIKQ